MENASKALLMAGGMLLTILVVTLLIYAWNTFSDYYSSQDELKNIDNITEFNLQFTSYDRNDVSGYELISLANKVADYNMRYSNSADARNDEQYTPITLEINFVTEQNRQKFVYDGTNKLFTNNNITQSDAENEITKIITDQGITESRFGSSETATKIAKNINSLSLAYYENLGKNDEEAKQEVTAKFNYLMKTNYDYTQVLQYLGDNGDTIKKYYEYYQFKKGIFECDSDNIQYDPISGRVSEITFIFTGEIE